MAVSCIRSEDAPKVQPVWASKRPVRTSGYLVVQSVGKPDGMGIKAKRQPVFTGCLFYKETIVNGLTRCFGAFLWRFRRWRFSRCSSTLSNYFTFQVQNRLTTFSIAGYGYRLGELTSSSGIERSRNTTRLARHDWLTRPAWLGASTGSLRIVDDNGIRACVLELEYMRHWLTLLDFSEVMRFFGELHDSFLGVAS